MSGGRLQASSRRLATTVLGCAFLWLCLKSGPLALTRGIQSGMITPPASALGLYALYAAALVAAALALTRTLATEGRVRRERVCAVVGAACGAGGLAMLSANASVAMLVGALVLVGAFIGSYLALWGMRLADLASCTAPAAIALSYALAELIRFLVSLADIGALRPLFPLVTLVFLLVTPLPVRANVPSEHASLSSLSWGMVVMCALLVALWSFALGMLPNSADAAMGESLRSAAPNTMTMSPKASRHCAMAMKARLNSTKFSEPTVSMPVTMSRYTTTTAVKG